MVLNGERIARTVLGDIPAGELGVNLPHEHVFCDLASGRYQLPADPATRLRALEPLKIESLWWVREHHLVSRDNIILDDVPMAARELARFRSDGGSSMIDLTCEGLGRRPVELAQVSAMSGVHIVLGCGLYVEPSHPAETASLGVEQLAERFIREIEVGIDGTSIRAGVIGEIGCSWPVTEREQAVLAASAMAQLETGVAIVVHTGRDRLAGVSHVAELERLGVDPGRVVISHVERRIDDEEALLELAATGCYLALDCFGLEPWVAFQVTRGMPMPCDLERIAMMETLFEHGFRDRVLISHDIAMKHRLTEYGGHGYGHILRWVVPILSQKGFSSEDISTLLVDNPARVFAFAPSRSGAEE